MQKCFPGDRFYLETQRSCLLLLKVTDRRAMLLGSISINYEEWRNPWVNEDLGWWSLPTDHDVGKDPSFIAIGKGKSPPPWPHEAQRDRKAFLLSECACWRPGRKMSALTSSSVHVYGLKTALLQRLTLTTPASCLTAYHRPCRLFMLVYNPAHLVCL